MKSRSTKDTVYSIVDATDSLDALMASMVKAEYVTIDTEFVRDNSYWSKLCLIQIASDKQAAIIDPLSDGIDLSSFHDLLRNENVTKVLHACRQDLEIFYQADKVIPIPLFDTQIAAMVCGFGDSVGYERLVAKFTNHNLDKSQRFTDWARRPLTEKQLDYAIGDVTHLRDIYKALAATLERTGRQEWLEEEEAILTNPGTYELDPEDAWRRLKTRSNDRTFLAVLKTTASWREEQAREKNLPRNRIVRDEALMEIAATKPKDQRALSKLRHVGNGVAMGRMGKQILEALKIGLEMEGDERPSLPQKRKVPASAEPTVELLKVLLKHKCTSHEVAQKLVANTSDLEKIAIGDLENVPALQGWRNEVFGEDALKLREGKLALSVIESRTTVIDVSDRRQ